MEVQIDVQLFANGAKFLQSGSCSVITTDFRKEPEWTAAVSAYEWIQKIKNSVRYPGLRFLHLSYIQSKVRKYP